MSSDGEAPRQRIFSISKKNEQQQSEQKDFSTDHPLTIVFYAFRRWLTQEKFH